MLSNMEKFINFKELNVVKTGTSTANGASGLTLTDSAAFFTQLVLPRKGLLCYEIATGSFQKMF